ncbi:hypothetical protein D3C86_1422460 [compost metagenome]
MKPSDNEIEMLAAGFSIQHKNGLIRFAHALLDKYAPQASEAVRILFPAHLRKMWSGGEVQGWLDEHQGITPPKASARGSMERYRKWQADQAQADKDGGDCGKGAQKGEQ